MPDPDDSFRTLMRGLQRGSPEAAETFCRTYQPHILRVVRRRLMKSLRIRYDPQDLVNDVWLSFFSRPPQDRQFQSPIALIVFLEKMARNKVIETAKRAWRGKNSLAREDRSESTESCIDRSGRYPLPSEVLIAEEEFARLLAGKPPHHQRILTLLRDGLRHEDIARRLGTNAKTVQRLVRRLQRGTICHE
jgi:RNA polymerase sigma factor (sigma-70 family)